MLTDGSKQELNKIRWRKINGGGQLREYVYEEVGHNLVRMAMPEEVAPNKKYYMVDPMKPNIFYETSFDPAVSWETIMEFVTTKKIYIRNGEDKRTKERPPVRVTDQRLF